MRKHVVEIAGIGLNSFYKNEIFDQLDLKEKWEIVQYVSSKKAKGLLDGAGNAAKKVWNHMKRAEEWRNETWRKIFGKSKKEKK